MQTAEPKRRFHLPTANMAQPSWPMPHTPNGWYGVATQDEITRRKPVALECFGRQLVAFRGEDNRVRVLDAYCPHLGTHLAHGGKVRGNTIECPFHGWQFGEDGRCVHAPFAKHTPDVGVRCWRVLERSGVVYVWFHAKNAEPDYEPPEVQEIAGMRGWRMAPEIRGVYRTHIQELRENIVDESHFQFIHRQVDPPEQTFETRGPWARMVQTLHVWKDRLPTTVTFTADMYGPGVMAVRTEGPLCIQALALTTPRADGHSEMRLLTAVKNPLGSRVLGAAFAAYYGYRSRSEVAIEEQIWNHKTHLQRPALLAHERGIPRLRRWYKQFYDGSAYVGEENTES